MEEIRSIKDFGKHVYLTLKAKRMILVSIVILSVVPGTMLLFLPQTMRLVYASVYLLLTEIMVFCWVQLIAGTALQAIRGALYNRKYKPEACYYPEVKAMAKKMNIKYDSPILITDNPSIKSPFANTFSGAITLPRFWVKKFHRTETVATIGHELAHIKYSRRFSYEILLVAFATLAFTLLLAAFTIPVIYQIAEFAFALLMISPILRRNEYRADMEGSNAATPEALISVFECLQAESKRDDGSETHPSFQERIRRLMPLLDSDRRRRAKN